jgi:hypothetical protein
MEAEIMREEEIKRELADKIAADEGQGGLFYTIPAHPGSKIQS